MTAATLNPADATALQQRLNAAKTKAIDLNTEYLSLSFSDKKDTAAIARALAQSTAAWQEVDLLEHGATTMATMRKKAAAALAAAAFDEAAGTRRDLLAKAQKLVAEQADLVKQLLANIVALRDVESADQMAAGAQRSDVATGGLEGRDIWSSFVSLSVNLPDEAQLDRDFRSTEIALEAAAKERRP